MDTNLITIIGGIIVLAIVVGVTTLMIKKRNNNDTKAAIEFLNGLGNELINIIIKTVKEIDPSEIDSAEEFEIIVLNAVYDKSWDYVQEQINLKLEDDSIIKTIINIVDKNYVIKFIDELCEKAGLTENIQGEYAAYRLSVNNTEEQDEALATEYSDEEKYHTDEVTDEDLEPAVDPVHTEEEIAALNPQKDEEEEFDATDESMELLPEDDELGKVIAIKDSIGRWCFYEFDKEGKKNRISKTEALPRLKEQGDSDDILIEIEEHK